MSSPPPPSRPPREHMERHMKSLKNETVKPPSPPTRPKKADSLLAPTTTHSVKMRPTEILKDKLWLGPHPVSSVTSMEILRKAKITLIVNCSKNLSFPKPGDIPTLRTRVRVNVDDLMSEDVAMREKIVKILPFIAKEFERSEGRVYVHCAMGISRSSTVVIAYRMHYLHENLKEAYERTKRKRSIIAPNPGFFKVLVEREIQKYGGEPSISLKTYEYMNVHESMKNWYWLPGFDENVVKQVLNQNQDADMSKIKRILVDRIHTLLDKKSSNDKSSNDALVGKIPNGFFTSLPPTTTIDRVADYSKVPYVLCGYREPTPNMASCLRSIVFQLHKETVNVWSHLAGALYFVNNFIRHVRVNEHDFESDAFALICVFYIGAILCFALSANYHTFTNLSDFKRFEFVLTMDFVGICALIYSSFIPGVYFGFACFPRLQVFYCIITTVLIMMCVLCALDSETGLLGKIRVALTAGTVIFGLVPLFHWCAIMPYEEVYKFFPPTISMLAMYGLGFVFYITRFPESKFPNRFDLLGSSHQFWHVAVLTAAIMWQGTLVKFAKMEHVCPAVEVQRSIF